MATQTSTAVDQTEPIYDDCMPVPSEGTHSYPGSHTSHKSGLSYDTQRSQDLNINPKQSNTNTYFTNTHFTQTHPYYTHPTYYQPR